MREMSTLSGDAKSNALQLRPSPQSYNNSKTAKQALQGKHNNSKQQSKRYKAKSTTTATRAQGPATAEVHTEKRWASDVRST